MVSTSSTYKDWLKTEEPSVLSDDPYERKLARRLRIQKRAEALQKLDGQNDTDDIAEESLTEKQIIASAELLEKLIAEGNEIITNVRIANDAREAERRRRSSEIRQELLRRLDESADSCKSQYDLINEQWISIFVSNDPLIINEEMKYQKKKCDQVLVQKDTIILELKNELRRIDKEYLDDQIRQKDDIKLVIERIENQMSTMENFYSQELDLIKSTLKRESDNLVQDFRNKWDALYAQQEHEDIAANEKREKIMREYEEEMEKVMREHEEEYRKQKIYLEKEYEAMQQQVEKMKALCQLNTEKLDYDYIILKNREEENAIVKSQQKRKINKFQTIINNMKKHYADLEESMRSEIEHLSNYILKTYNSIVDLEEKSCHFTRVNEKQYLDIWDMNEQQANELTNKILETDKLIHERILGIVWDPPRRHLPKKEDLPSYRATMFNIQKKKQEDAEKLKIFDIDRIETPSSKVQFERKMLNNVLQQISKCSGFLIEDKLKKIISNYSDEEKAIISLDNIFQALSICTAEEINILLNFFLPYAFCPICSALNDTSSENLTKSFSSEHSTCMKSCKGCQDENIQKLIDCIRDEVRKIFYSKKFGKRSSSSSTFRSEMFLDEELEAKTNSSLDFKSPIEKYTCKKGHILEIQAAHVIKAMKEIVTKFSIAEQKKMLSFEEKLKEKKYVISRNLSIEDVKNFWSSYQEMFDPQKEKLWDAILVGLNKYYEVLKERHNLCNQIESLTKQNAELEHLLESHTKNHSSSTSLMQVKSAKRPNY